VAVAGRATAESPTTTQEIVHMTRLQLGDARAFFWVATMPGRGKPDPRIQRLLFSNEVSLKLQDDHPTPLSGEAALPLRIDGDGHAWLVSIGRGKTRPATRGAIRTEAVLDQEHLDRLAKFLRDQKLWELPDLSQSKIANPDEGEIRLSVGAGRGSLVGSVPNSTVRAQPKLQALQAEMAKVMALVITKARKDENAKKAAR
jgi:hypothetical protein